MARDWRVRLEDMQDAIARIEKISTNDLDSSDMAGPALERAFEIISEASRHIPPKAKALYPHIRWQDLADLGNVLRHGYHRVSRDALWNSAQTDLPPLKAALRKIKEEDLTL